MANIMPIYYINHDFDLERLFVGLYAKMTFKVTVNGRKSHNL